MEEITIMKDEDITVIAPTRAIVKGQLTVIPNKEYLIVEQIPQNVFSKMFQIANRLSSILFDTLGCQGTNIIIQNGTAAGQISKVSSLSILPRYENDGLGLEWTPTPANEENLKISLERFKSIDEEELDIKLLQDQKNKIEATKKEEIINNNSDDESKENYFLKSMDRLP